MKKYTLLKSGVILVIALSLNRYSYTQVVFSDWMVGAGTMGWDIVNDIACDASGNIYITGSNTDTVSKSKTVSIATNMRKCMFIAKYDSAGKLLLNKNILKPSSGFGSLISIVKPDQIILAGGTETEKRDNKAQPGKFDFFISSLDSTGKINWKQNFTGFRNDFLTSMLIDTLREEIIVIGYFHDTLSISGKTFITKGKSDGFLLRLDMNGTFKDAQIIGGKGDDYLSCITTNTYGDLFAAGTFQRKIQFAKNKSLELSNPHQVALFLTKYNHAGDFISTKQLITGKKLKVNAILCQDNLCFVAGSFSDDITINNQVLHSNGSDDIFLLCLDSGLQVKWYKQIGGTRKDRTAGIINTGKEIILTGSFCSEIKVDQKKLTLSGLGSDLFLMAVDTTGTLKWLRNAGGDADDYPTCMTYGPSNCIYVAGSFRKSFNLNGKTIQSNGEEDLFICRLENCRILAPVFKEPESFCQGNQLKLDAGEGFISYNWENGLSAEQTFIVDLGGNYSLELFAGNGCFIYDTIKVIDVALPSIDLGNDTTITDTSCIILHADSNFARYLWNNGITKPENKIKGTELNEGTNLVKLTVTNDKGGVGDDDIVITMIRTNKIQFSEIVSGSCVLFPNPTQEMFTVSFTLSYESLSLVVYDPMGKDVFTRIVTNYVKNTPLEFSFGAMPKGLYTLYIETELGNATKKIILD